MKRSLNAVMAYEEAAERAREALSSPLFHVESPQTAMARARSCVWIATTIAIRRDSNDMKRTRLLLADDHAIVLEAFKKLLEPFHLVVGAVTDGRQLLAKAKELRPQRAEGQGRTTGQGGRWRQRSREQHHGQTVSTFAAPGGMPKESLLAAAGCAAAGSGFKIESD